MIKYNELLFIITYLLRLGQIMLTECSHVLGVIHGWGPSGVRHYPVVSVFDDSNLSWKNLFFKISIFQMNISISIHKKNYTE